MQEAGVVLDLEGKPIHWHTPVNRNTVALPDSPDLWTILWANRDHVSGVAHSHPGGGIPGPSYEDVTTFSATEMAFGRRLTWWITSSDATTVWRWKGPKSYSYEKIETLTPGNEPMWIEKLRLLSGIGVV